MTSSGLARILHSHSSVMSVGQTQTRLLRLFESAQQARTSKSAIYACQVYTVVPPPAIVCRVFYERWARVYSIRCRKIVPCTQNPIECVARMIHFVFRGCSSTL